MFTSRILVLKVAHEALPKKTKSVMVSRSRTKSTDYGDLTLGGAELGDAKSLRILVVPLDPKLTFETHFREVVSKTARNLGVMHRAGKLFDDPRILKSCFKAYVLSSLVF